MSCGSHYPEIAKVINLTNAATDLESPGTFDPAQHLSGWVGEPVGGTPKYIRISKVVASER
jgi:hypothetical protein